MRMSTRTLTLCILSFFALASARGAPNSSTSDLLRSLRAISKQNRKDMDRLEADLRKAVETSLATSDSQTVDHIQVQIGDERKEKIMRQEFIDRLIFRVDTHYRDGMDSKSFFLSQLSEIAMSEATDPNGDNTVWKFVTYLTVAMKEQMEKSENPVAFIEGYMTYSSIVNPTRPEEYVRLRSYTNGIESVAARGTPREMVGEVVEARMLRLQPQTLRTRGR